MHRHCNHPRWRKKLFSSFSGKEWYEKVIEFSPYRSSGIRAYTSDSSRLVEEYERHGEKFRVYEFSYNTKCCKCQKPGKPLHQRRTVRSFKA